MTTVKTGIYAKKTVRVNSASVKMKASFDKEDVKRSPSKYAVASVIAVDRCPACGIGVLRKGIRKKLLCPACGAELDLK